MDLKQTRIMDLLQYFLYTTVAVLVFVKDLRADISVTTTVNPVGLVGNNELELVCTYSLTSSDRLFSIAWNREITKDSGTYEQLASFSPPGSNQAPATLLNLTNPTVFGRIVLTNPTDSSLTAKIKFTSVVCGDERKYQCSVQGLNNNIQANPSSETSLTVTAHPNATSFGEVEVVPASNIEEGRTVQFTCTSNVGRPAGTFLWTKYRDISDSVGSTVTSTTQTSPSTDCTFTGSSVINIPMTKDDNDVIIRCTLQQETLSDPTDNAYYKQTDPIKVYYQVRTPTITKNPTKDMHYEGEDLTLNCAAEGNPTPTYIWRRNGTQLGTTAQLSLTNIKIDQSGDYVCEAKNNFTGTTYNLSEMISITIVPTSGGGGTKSPQGGDGNSGGIDTTIIIVIVVVVVVVIIVVAVVAFICLKRRNANKSIEEPPEKPRNNSDLSFVNKPPDVTRNDEKRNIGYNNFDKGKGDLQYADLTFDDRPRSRRPIQILDTDLGPTTYSEVTMPSV
ncbi:leucine-rich repeats and immunoglobulin-like domains protein 2 isoform X2 [Pecten maximus]|uniref:leucine-rich repeats and immunoglobulin-like domains protein 2 isoform X2 n=1 Tax=Pecten maximus TaxID=6579 RepID=UPI001458EE26|nr:leucine-rich repeats and immunoglobulin-like domains protein 2 isoform X2 [Pecten maximus]